jgi:AraC-like DNA-binding protein
MAVSADSPRAPIGLFVLAGVGVDHGLEERACLRGTRLTLDALRTSESGVTVRDELAVIRNIVTGLPTLPDLGLTAGKRYHLTTYGIWGFAVVSSPTLRSAIDVGLRFLDLTFALCPMRQRPRGDALEFVLGEPDVPAAQRRFVIERDAAGTHTITQELFGSTLRMRRVAFALPKPEDSTTAFETVFGVQPVFDAPETVLEFDPAVLDLPLPQANPVLTALAQMQCRDLLERRASRVGTAGAVRDLLLATLPEPVDAGAAAVELNISERTLRRRLAEEGTSFRGLLDELRESLADQLLVVGGLSVAEVARRLGYVELSSFSQAFRRWKGVGPRAYRSASRPTSD